MTNQPGESQVPIWPHFVPVVLRILAGGDTLRRRDLLTRTIDAAELSDAARAETLASGGGRAENRAQWAATYVGKAGWIERPARGTYRITQAGRDWLAAHPDAELSYADANQIFGKYLRDRRPRKSTPTDPVVLADEAVVDPVEQIDNGVTRLRDEIADELLDRLRASDPAFFEKAVVDVLLAMGYGGAEQRGKRIGGTGDGGVDGVIDQDALGLERIYVQAKRYAEGNTVGRETIQAFIGALHGLSANRGVFITTSGFTQHARDYVQHLPTRVILIDGRRLVDLMITYRVGVEIADTYHVFKVDEDFFE